VVFVSGGQQRDEGGGSDGRVIGLEVGKCWLSRWSSVDAWLVGPDSRYQSCAEINVEPEKQSWGD
jgi:hypothetical protein